MSQKKGATDVRTAGVTQPFWFAVKLVCTLFFSPSTSFYPPHLSQAVLDDLTALKRYILDAHSEVGHDLLISFFKWLFKAGYDGTRDFSRAFSFESTVLFTITIMSTVGCSHMLCIFVFL